MIGVMRIYGNYWSSPVRDYLEENKIPAELIGSDWVVVKYGGERQLESIISKVLEIKGSEKKFTNIDSEIESVDPNDVKAADNMFRTQNHKEYSEDFLRGYVWASNVVLGERLSTKNRIDEYFFSK